MPLFVPLLYLLLSWNDDTCVWRHAMDDEMEHIASSHNDFVNTVVYCGSVTMGNFTLRFGKIVHNLSKYNLLELLK